MNVPESRNMTVLQEQMKKEKLKTARNQSVEGPRGSESAEEYLSKGGQSPRVVSVKEGDPGTGEEKSVPSQLLGFQLGQINKVRSLLKNKWNIYSPYLSHMHKRF